MQIISFILKPIWKAFFVLNFLLGLVTLYPVFRILLWNEKTFGLAFKLMRFWAAWILYVPGIIVRIKGKHNLKGLPKATVFCANHFSYLDIPVSYRVNPNYFVYMGKAELRKAPLFSVFFERMNILVERKKNVGAHKAFGNAREHLEKGHGVFLYPEGTISKKAPRMLDFKNGTFKLAIETQAPIVPVTFVSNFKRLQTGGYFKAFGGPGISKVIIHPPIYTEGLNEADYVSLRDKVYSIIEAPLKAQYGH